MVGRHSFDDINWRVSIVSLHKRAGTVSKDVES